MNKVLIKLYVPILDEVYDIWFPLNKKIYNIIHLLVKVINELNDNCYNCDNLPRLYDKKTAEEYDVNLILKDTNIRNGAELILL